MANILVGTCNWSDFPAWYPKGVKPAERIRYYAQHFSLVEIDSTFYHLMPRRNFEGWAAKTPQNFVFDVKAYRTLTRHGAAYEEGKVHADADPAYDPAEDDFEKFKYQIEPLREAGKLRAVLFQFPPWFKHTPANLEHLEVCREYMADYLIAVEFRHGSWLAPAVADETLAFLRDREIVYTVVDEPQIGSASVPPVVAVTNPDLAMVRFHGRNAGTWYMKGAESSRERFNYLYSPEELAEWASNVEEMAERASEVHVLMNNNYGPVPTRSGDGQSYQAIINAQEMQDLLAGE
jgi:uncharacterized protein YecE (DUF72 family)